MKKIILNIVWGAALVLLVSCNAVKSFDAGKKHSATQLKRDLSLLKNILEKNHPGLYWYTSKDSVNYYFNVVEAALKDSLTESEFKNRVAWVISKLKCGHTSVRNSKKFTEHFLSRRAASFPLSIKLYSDTAVVVGSSIRNDTIFKRGTVVKAINGRSIPAIRDSMFGLLSTDGYADIFKQQVISFNFPAYYRNAFGTASQYRIQYLDTIGQERSAVVKSYIPRTDSIQRIRTITKGIRKRNLRKFTLLSRRNMVIDTALSAAVITVNTFSDYRLKRFFKKSFRSIKDQNIQNVAIDLRQNSGGNVLASTRLIQYLTDKPYHIADTISAINRSFPYKKYISPWFIYWLSMHFSGHAKKDGLVHFNYFEKHEFKPKLKNHFNGNIYIVTSGYTFSAASLVAGALKGQKNVTLVGEETGGGSYGNTAMHITNIVLPETGLRVTLPLYRMVIDKTRPKNGRGVFPDVEIRSSAVSIKNGVDVKMEKVRELIKQKMGS